MEPVGPDDAELVTRTLAGDREAFGRLYDKYSRMVLAVVVGVSGDWKAAEDLVQECFLRAFRKLAALRNSERFGPWIVGIARRVALEHRRTKGRDKHEFHDLKKTAIDVTTDGPTNSQCADTIEAIVQHLVNLPERERIAVHLYFFEEQSALVAADALGLSRSGYYAVLQRAIARLAANLRTQPNEIKAK